MTGWANGDFNYDAQVNGTDYTLIDNAFNTQGASLAAEVAADGSTLTHAIAYPPAVGKGTHGKGMTLVPTSPFQTETQIPLPDPISGIEMLLQKKDVIDGLTL